MKVCHLRTQHRKNPVGITELPEFSWRMESSRRNVKQESYRIVVKKENDEIVWDSEVINSGKQAFVPYEGKKLESACSYHLWVSVWDNYGESACTEGSFETGILNAYEWKGKWIESSTDRSSACKRRFPVRCFFIEIPFLFLVSESGLFSGKEQMTLT